MSEGYGQGTWGSGGFGIGPDVTIAGPTAGLTIQAWAGGLNGVLSIEYITASGHTVSAGTATDVVGITGSIRDLFYVGGLASSPTNDPLMTAVLGHSYPTEVNNAWVRPWVEALSPSGFWTKNATVDTYSTLGATQLWPTADYGVLGVSFNAVAVNEIHYIDDGQFEHNTLSTWDNPRDTKIKIIPDRINALPKQLFISGTTSPLVATGSTLAITGAGLSATWTANPGYFTYPVTIPTDLNKGWVTVSLTVYNPVVAVQITPVAATPYTQTYTLNSDNSVRISCSYAIGTNGVADFKVAPIIGGFAGVNLTPLAVNPLAATTGSYVGAVSIMSKFQAEAAPSMGSYFDSTYLYTNDVLVGASGAVSLFQDRKVKNYRLTQILNQTMPVGATFTLSYNTY